MEIVDYLKVARRRLWIIVVIPLLAAAGVLGNWQFSAKSYEAAAYVFAPNLLGATGSQFSGPAGVGNWVNEFSATAVSPRVTRRVAAETGVPASEIARGIEVTQLHQSGQLRVSFSSTDRSLAEKVVKAEATRTPKALFAPDVAQAEQAMAKTEDSLAAVNQRILDASMTWGHTRPDLLYAGRLNAMVDLENSREDLKAEGDLAGMAAADAKIARVKGQLDALQQDVIEFQSLNAQRQAATTVLARAQEGLQTAQAQYASASGAVTVLPATPTRLSSVLLKGVLAAVVAGLVIAFCLVAALELLRGRHETAADPVVVMRSKQVGQSSSKRTPSTRPKVPSRKPKPARAKAVPPVVVDVAAGRGDR